MNLKQLSLAALASMALFACSNDESLGGSDENGTPKAVYMKLEGISAPAVNGRSTDAPTGSNDDDHAVTISDVAVIFYQNGGNITNVETIASTDETKWKALVEPTSGDGCRFVVGHKADKVMVIGNYQNLKEKTDIEGKVVANQPISEVTGFQIPLSSQNVAGTGTDKTTKACVTLYGDAPMIKKTSDASEDNNYDVYKAEVNIAPIISRVEIKSLGCVFNKQNEGTAGTPTEHLYASVTVKGIGMVDYYNTGTLGNNYSNQMVANTTSNSNGLIYDPEYAFDVAEGGYKFCGGENASWGWSYDMIGAPSGITLSSGDVSSDAVTKYVGKSNETATKSESQTFAYNFFPKDEIANVRVWVEAKKADENAKKSFVVTANFKNQESGGTVVKPQAGNIYQFDYLFNETVPGVWDKDQKVVYVKVTVKKWTVTPVYPDFH